MSHCRQRGTQSRGGWGWSRVRRVRGNAGSSFQLAACATRGVRQNTRCVQNTPPDTRVTQSHGRWKSRGLTGGRACGETRGVYENTLPNTRMTRTRNGRVCGETHDVSKNTRPDTRVWHGHTADGYRVGPCTGAVQRAAGGGGGGGEGKTFPPHIQEHQLTQVFHKNKEYRGRSFPDQQKYNVCKRPVAAPPS